MLDTKKKQQLKELAKASIENGLKYGRAINVDINDLADELTVTRATFVTLKKQGELRGCIGMLEARRALAIDIAEINGLQYSDVKFEANESLITYIDTEVDEAFAKASIENGTFETPQEAKDN